MFVYREPDPEADAREEREAAYWYDLAAGDAADARDAGDREPAAPAVSEVRGPFEPLVSSGGSPSGQAPPPRAEAEPAAASPARAAPAAAAPAAAAPGPIGAMDPRAQKLEQIKDLYLTAAAIGEENVGKHFDELLAQQRSLISDYFKKPPGAETDRQTPETAGGTEGAGVAAERPGAR